MVATARAFGNGGFGASGPPTALVYLNWTTGSQAPMQILGVHDESDQPVNTPVEMQWLAPTHLELTYNGKLQKIDFQAVKYDGVEISLRDASTEK
jgi:hypothetical protein